VGVYEAREFVRAHGGTVDVQSALGRGTTFQLRFALAGAEAPLSVAVSA